MNQSNLKIAPGLIISELKHYIGELVRFLKVENDDLDKFNYDNIIKNSLKKYNLMTQIEKLEGNVQLKEAMDKISLDQKKDLFKDHEELSHLLQLNQSKLKVVKAINEKFINIVYKKINEKRISRSTYNIKGSMKQVISGSSPLSFDKDA